MNLPVWLGPALMAAFAVVWGMQLFYYLYFFRRLAWYQPPVVQSSQEYPVSVVVCARDEADNLERHLPSVLSQQYRTTHEVVVVNDNSVDESKYLLEELHKLFRHLHIVPLTQEAKGIVGKKFPLSMGIKSARHEVLLLTDADCSPASEHWMQKMQSAYRPGTDIVLGYGPYQKLPGLLNKIIRFETFHSALLYLSFALAGRPYMGVGRNLSYRKNVFLKNKGFSSISQLPGGDDDLFINQVATSTNTAIMIDPDSFTYSRPKQRWSEWMFQKTRHYSTGRYYKAGHQWSLGAYSLSHGLLYPLLLAASLTFPLWWLPLALFGVRMTVQGTVWRKSMQRLGETDLWPAFVLWDLWMPVYYVIFTAALWKKPRNRWR